MDGWLASFATAMAWVLPVQDWLLDRPELAWFALAGFHLAVMPWLAAGALLGWNQDRDLLIRNPHQMSPADRLHERVSVWANVLWFSCGFMIPLVLGLTLDVDLAAGWYLGVLFGPYVLAAGVIWLLLERDRRYGPSPQTPAPRWFLPATLLLVAAYLTTLETAVWAARLKGGVLGEGPLYFGMLALGWLPLRVTLHYATSGKRSQVLTTALAFGWLLLQLLATSPAP